MSGFLSARGKGAVPASTSPPCTRPWTRPCQHVNLEERAGRLHFCLYRFHDWPDHTLFWLPVDFTESLPVPLRRIVREFIRRFVRYHGLNAVTETWYYELAMEELDDWKNRDPEASLRQSVNTNAWRNPTNPGKSQKHLNEWKGNRFVPI